MRSRSDYAMSDPLIVDALSSFGVFSSQQFAETDNNDLDESSAIATLAFQRQCCAFVAYLINYIFSILVFYIKNTVYLDAYGVE